MPPRPSPLLGRGTRASFRTLLDAVALQGPDERTALIQVATGSDPRILTRRELRERIRRHAAALAALGVRPRDLVVIAHAQELEAMLVFWGALALGAVPSMLPALTEKLDPEIYLSQVSALVAHSGVRAVLTSDDLARALSPRLSCPVYGSSQLSAAVREGAGAESGARTPDPSEIAFLQHSSGTTGLQKGVALSHAAVLNQLASYSDSLGDRKSVV